VALLRYAAGAEVPVHRHDGYEFIYVLEGEQSDERGSYSAGSFVINEPGVSHAVVSAGGCVVLIHWQRPVVFL
jgi:anti-sigma factor ChrR (cupin superfamily)